MLSASVSAEVASTSSTGASETIKSLKEKIEVIKTTAKQCYTEVCPIMDPDSKINNAVDFIKKNPKLVDQSHKVAESKVKVLSEELSRRFNDLKDGGKKAEYSKRLKLTLDKYKYEITQNANYLCAAEYADNYLSLPTAEQIQNQKELADTYEADYLAKLKPKLSKKTYSRVKRAITASNYYYKKEDKEKYLSEVIKETEQSAFERKKIKDLYVKYWSALIDENFAYSNGLTDDELKVALTQMIGCHDVKDKETLEDSNSPSVDLKKTTHSDVKVKFKFVDIEISSKSIANPELGKYIFFHEMSHTLYYVIGLDRKVSGKSKSKYLSIVSCLSKKHNTSHVNENNILLGIIGDNFFVAEDFADLYAAELLGTEVSNPWCGSVNTPIIEGGSEKGHSTGFFRLLHAEKILKNKLPKSCDKAIKAQDYKKDFFNSCIDSAKK